jgi:cytochrome c
MMKKMLFFAALLLLPFVSMNTASAADKAEIAQSMVEKAIAHYKEVGYDKAVADFNNKDGAFVDGEFYVINFTKDGMFKTHAINPKLIDNPKLPSLKDVNGKVILDEMIKGGQAGPEGGWSEYTWTNPATKKLSPKKTFAKEYDGYYFGVGYYE